MLKGAITAQNIAHRRSLQILLIKGFSDLWLAAEPSDRLSNPSFRIITLAESTVAAYGH